MSAFNIVGSDSYLSGSPVAVCSTVARAWIWVPGAGATSYGLLFTDCGRGMSHTVPKRRDGDADDPCCGPLGRNRRSASGQAGPASRPFAETKANHVDPAASTVPDRFPPSNASYRACSRNARVSTPDRPVSSKSRRPGKAELGVQVIARDPDHFVRSVQWGHPALWRESRGH